MLGAIYVPPENSRFFTTDEFDIFENSITEMCHNHKYVMLAGDFNSRTGHLSDFSRSDHFLLNHFNIELEDQSALDQHSILENLSIPLELSSEDSITNALGSRLIDICRNNNLFILNGRVHKDTTGRFTFKYNSVIDYIISTADCFQHISNFDVTKTDTLLSDGHSLLHLEIGSKLLPTNHDIPYETHRSPRWDNELSSLFANNIDLRHLDAIIEILDSQDRSQSTVECVTNEISLLFNNASHLTFTQSTNGMRKHLPFTNKNKPWFGAKCHQAREKYHRAKKKYNSLPNDYNKRMLDKKSKEYKQIINFHVKNYKLNKVNKLRSLSSKKPKHYWKFLHSLKPSSRDDDTPTLHEFYEHFKNINRGGADSSNFPVSTPFVCTNYELNSTIQSSEIESCISNLNNGKSCSPIDNILNEYIKNTKDLLLPLYTKLFNCVLDTGFIPISWVKGVIIPVFKNKGDPMQTQNYRPITILSCLGKLFTSIINTYILFSKRQNMSLAIYNKFNKGRQNKQINKARV